MSYLDWPHAHLSHQFKDLAVSATDAGEQVYTVLPRKRSYPLLVVATSGLGPIGMDSAIQADQIRLQTDAWAETRQAAEQVAAQLFRAWDKRFPTGIQDQVLLTEDEAHPGDWYRTNVEKVERSGGGDVYFDEFAKKWRVTTFYLVKVNL